MPKIPGRHFAHNLVQRRTLLFQLVRRDFEQRFVGSAAGWLWTIIHPLVMLVSWVFVFQGCFGFSLPAGSVTQNYPLYLFCGYLPWYLFQDTVQRSASSILDQSNLITKTVFPSEVLPVSVFLSCLLSHLITLALAMAAAAWWESRVSFMVVLLPVYMLLIGLFARARLDRSQPAGLPARYGTYPHRDPHLLVLADPDFHQRG